MREALILRCLFAPDSPRLHTFSSLVRFSRILQPLFEVGPSTDESLKPAEINSGWPIIMLSTRHGQEDEPLGVPNRGPAVLVIAPSPCRAAPSTISDYSIATLWKDTRAPLRLSQALDAQW